MGRQRGGRGVEGGVWTGRDVFMFHPEYGADVGRCEVIRFGI